MKIALSGASLAFLMLTGCSSPEIKNTQVSSSLIESSLLQVADEIRATQYIVANVGRAKIDPPDLGMVDVHELYQPISVIDWHGELEVIVSDIADRVGYKFQMLGKKPAIAYIVHSDYNQMPVNDVLRDLSLQAGTGVQINANPQSRVLTLKYLKH